MATPLKDTIARRPSDIWSNSNRFAAGEWIKIKAPSGSGKTTLIHILYRLRHDYEGTVYWGETNLRTMDADELARFRQQKVSIIFQDLRLFENLTARENIELKRVLTTPKHTANVVDEMADRLGIRHILHRQVAICSYGEQQRIAIIRALVQPFEWLMMDEPFSHLDAENTARAAALIAEVCRENNAGLVITDLDENNHFNYSRRLQL